MAYCTVVIKNPKVLNKAEIKKKFKSDQEYLTKKKDIDDLLKELSYLKLADKLNIFSGKRTSERRSVVFFSDGNIEIHCELVSRLNKYNGLYEQGIKIYDDIKRILKVDIELVQMTISDSSDELVCKVLQEKFSDKFLQSFTSSWLDRFILMLAAGLVVFFSTENSVVEFFKNNAHPIILYASFFVLWPLLKTIFWFFKSSKRFKKEFTGM